MACCTLSALRPLPRPHRQGQSRVEPALGRPVTQGRGPVRWTARQQRGPPPALDLRWMFPPGRNQGTLVRDHKFPRNLGADEALGGIRGEVPMAEKLHKKSKYFIPNPLANRPSVLSVAWSPLLPLVHL